LKITLPVIALLHNMFSENHACIVARIGPSVYRHGVFQKEVAAWFKKVTVWYTVPHRLTFSFVQDGQWSQFRITCYRVWPSQISECKLTLRVICSDSDNQSNCRRRQFEDSRQPNTDIRLSSDRYSGTAGGLDERWKADRCSSQW